MARWVLPVLVGPRTAVSRASESLMIPDSRVPPRTIQGARRSAPALSEPDEPQVDRLSALAQGLGFIAGSRPVGGADAPVARPPGGPGEGRMPDKVCQRPADQDGIIAGEPELGPRLQQAGQQVEVRRLDEARASMAAFRPWIGEQQEDPVERSVWQRSEQVARILRIDSDVGEAERGDLRQQ